MAGRWSRLSSRGDGGDCESGDGGLVMSSGGCQVRTLSLTTRRTPPRRRKPRRTVGGGDACCGGWPCQLCLAMSVRRSISCWPPMKYCAVTPGCWWLGTRRLVTSALRSCLRQAFLKCSSERDSTASGVGEIRAVGAACGCFGAEQAKLVVVPLSSPLLGVATRTQR